MGNEEPDERIIVCVRVEKMPIPARASLKRKCDHCNEDVWIAGVARANELIERGAKITCSICAAPIMLEYWTNDDEMTVRALEPEFEGLLDKHKDGIIARMIEDGMMNG